MWWQVLLPVLGWVSSGGKPSSKANNSERAFRCKLLPARAKSDGPTHLLFIFLTGHKTVLNYVHDINLTYVNSL